MTSIPPPPPPASRSGGGRAAAPSVGGPSIAPSSSAKHGGTADKATFWPVLIAGVGVILGVIPILLGENMALNVAGYFLAGFIPVMCLGWDVVAQRKGLANPNYMLKPRYTLFLRLIVLVGFAIAIWNLVLFALPLAEALSNMGGGH